MMKLGEPIRTTARELSRWSRARWAIASATALTAGVLLAMTGGFLGGAASDSATSGGAVAHPGAPWWAWLVTGFGALLIGLLLATFRTAPRGAEPVVCDLRWPGIGLVGLALATEAVNTAPMISAEVRPVVALAALAVLLYGLADRLSRERLAAAHNEAVALAGIDTEPGDSCTTCRPLFSERQGPRKP